MRLLLLMWACSAERPIEHPQAQAQALRVRLLVPQTYASFAADFDGDGRPDNRLHTLIWALFAWHHDVQAACDAAGPQPIRFEDQRFSVPLFEGAPPLELTLSQVAIGDGRIDGLADPRALAVSLAPMLTTVVQRGGEPGLLFAEEFDVGSCAHAGDGRIEACELEESPLGSQLLEPDIGSRLSAALGYVLE